MCDECGSTEILHMYVNFIQKEHSLKDW